MKHFKYLKTGIPMCEKSAEVGNDFVLFDYEADGPVCKECPTLATAFTEQKERERNLEYIFNYYSSNDGNAIQGLMVGLLISSVFWIVLFFILKAVL